MSFSRPALQQAMAPPNLTDAENQKATARQKRLQSGGRNSTFLTQASTAAADRSPATLTGLSGGGGGGV